MKKTKRVTPAAFALHCAANQCDDLAEIWTRRGTAEGAVAAKALRDAANDIRNMMAEDQR